jgi:ParB-like chromosome segregation protein Spo0J
MTTRARTSRGADATPLTIEHLPIDSLKPDASNPCRISEAELEALTRSIQEFGLVDPVIGELTRFPGHLD